jgi:hypothetical protein
MKKIVLTITLVFSINFLFAQELVWNQAKTVGLIPSKDWKLKANNDILSFQATTGTYNQNLKGQIDISSAPTNGWSLEKLWRIYVVEGFPQSLNGYKKIDEGKSTIDENESRWIEYLSESQGMKFHSYSATFMEKNTLYIVTCTSTPQYYESIKNEFSSMINSMKIKTLSNTK